MTKQITIKEDGVSKSESVDFINTQVAGGSANWMPEDDAQTGVFYVHANGEYVPSDYGLYGFYAVGVMVPGGNGAETIQPGSLTPTYVTPLPATGLGASVIGVDPTDGAMYRTEIQDVDGVPTMVKTKVADSKADYKPTSMKILIKPAKLSYNAGDKIQYAGLVVQLLDSTGYTFVDERFPQGIISWSPVKNLLYDWMNLITPLKEVDSGSVVPSGTIYMTTTEQVHYASSQATGGYPLLSHHIRGTSEHVRIVFNTYHQSYSSDRLDNVAFFAFSDEAGQSVIAGVGTSPRTYPLTYQYKGYYTYYTNGGPSVLNGTGWCTENPASLGLPHVSSLEEISVDDALGYAFGSGDHKMDVPVQWKSPYDNQTYEDTFEIQVGGTESPSSGSESSGGSSSGGGGGHSF